MSKSRYEVVGRLPPGQGGKTSLAAVTGANVFRRLSVLRPVEGAQLTAVANVHPQLPEPLSVEDVDGASVAVYDFFPGATLKEVCEVYGTQDQLPPLGMAARLVIDAARVLHVAHVHQDPLRGPAPFVHGGLADNLLLLGFDGEVRVLDFGLRRLNRFTAPEVLDGAPPTPRSDVFALAAALHSSLTGFKGEYASTLRSSPSSSQFPPPSAVHPDASPELDSLLMRALMPDPAGRLPAAVELGDDLERIVGADLPQHLACAMRLKELFEERLDGLRNMVPRLSDSTGAPARNNRAGPAAASTPAEAPARGSRAALPAMPAADAPKRPSRAALPAMGSTSKSGSRAIPKGTQPEVNPIGKQPTPSAGTPAVPPDDDLDDFNDQMTIVVGPGTAEPIPARLPPGLDANKTVSVPPRPSGERKPVRGSGERKPPKRPPSGQAEVPWEQGPAGGGTPNGLREGSAGPIPAAGALGIEDVPTGASRRRSGSKSAPVPGGSSDEEKARARGQELVQTGDLEPEEVDDLFDQPTVVRPSGTHAKLPAPQPDPFAAEEPEADEADADGPQMALSGDVEAIPDEPSTAMPTGPGAPDPNGPPVLHPVGESPKPPSLGEEPDTGVLEQHRRAAQAGKIAEQPTDSPKRKSGGGARKVIALLLLLMAGGLGYAQLKYPALVKAKFQAALVKWGLRKPVPPPELPPDALPVDEADGGAGDEAAEGAAVPASPTEEDGGEEYEEDDDGGVNSADAGLAADGGKVAGPAKKKKKHPREWWKTQER